MRRAIFAIVIMVASIHFYQTAHRAEPPKLVTLKSRGLSFQVATSTAQVVHGAVIEITKPVNVTLFDAGKKSEITTTAVTVNDLLYELKLPLAATDQVNPGLQSYLAAGQTIVIDRIVDLEVIEGEGIAYDVQLENDPESFYGRETIISAGITGNREKIFLITYKNGVEIKRKLLSARILQKPITEYRKFGTRIEIEEQREGRASWYATKSCLPAFALATAGKCAAHPFYEFGRYVRVTRLDTKQSIIVRINDRGPELDKHPDRVIDLDSVAYKHLAPLGSGTVGVRVELFRN